MKKLSLFLLLFSFLLSCSRMNTVELSGELEHGNGRVLHLSLLTAEGLQPFDSVVVRHNTFHFKLNADKVARGGESVSLKADANQLVASYRVSGSEDARLMWELDSALASFVRCTDTLLQIYHYYMDVDSMRGAVEQRYNKEVENHRQYLRGFIQSHPQSFSTMIAFYQGYNNLRFFDETEDADLLHSLTDSLTFYYPNSQYVRYLQSRIR